MSTDRQGDFMKGISGVVADRQRSLAKGVLEAIVEPPKQKPLHKTGSPFASWLEQVKLYNDVRGNPLVTASCSFKDLEGTLKQALGENGLAAVLNHIDASDHQK